MKENYLPLFTLLISFTMNLKQIYSLSNDSNSTLCQDFFKNLTDTSYTGPNVSTEITNFFLYSGHNINDLGAYKNCQELPTQKYSLFTISGFLFGFCGPSFCSTNQLQNYTDTIVSVVSKLTRKNLSALGIKFIDPEETEVKLGFSFYFTIFIFIFLIGLLVAGTVLSKLRKDKQNRQAQDLQQALLINRESSNEAVIHEFGISGLHKGSSDNNNLLKIPLNIKIIECFDIVSNFNELFKNEEVPGHDQNLNVLNGIRTLAFGWVVYGHTFMSGFSAKNILYAELLFKQTTWSLIAVAAFFAVDIFFYLSGFFTGFILISKLKKMKLSLKNYGMLLFHRWIRLWPAYVIAILFYWKFSVYFGSGPVWVNFVNPAQSCSDGIWKNLLFMDNVLNTSFSTYCFSWGWYLACDFQMFLLAPFICWLHLKDRQRSQHVFLILVTISLMASYSYSADTGYTSILLPDSNNGDNYMVEYYINPLVRMSPYLLGLWIGITFREYKQGEKNFFVCWNFLANSTVLSR